MARPDLGTMAEQLFVDFMAPLVLGGEMRPGHPIGGRAAISIGIERTVADDDRRAHVQLARIRTARRLAPIDQLADATASEWALAACLHDIVQSTHPGLGGLFRGSAPDNLRAMALETLRHVPKPRTVAEVLSRHTWFARMFEIARLDTTVSWWVGSREFLGTTPPKRLFTWPELRRVNVKKTQSFLPDLPSSDNGAEKFAFSKALTTFLRHTPLTDLCTLERAEPAFSWGDETLGLVLTQAGRTLAFRALRALPEPAVSAGLGAATRRLLESEAWRPLLVAMTLLGELALASAQQGILRGESPQAPSSNEDSGAAFARTAGALGAHERLTSAEPSLSPTERTALRAYLKPRCEGSLGRELRAALQPFAHFFPSFFANAAFSGASSRTSSFE